MSRDRALRGPSAALPGFHVRPLVGKPLRLFSIDVEEWFHSNFVSAPRIDARGLPRRADVGVARLIDALAEARSRATFFVLGALAEEQPAIVRRIAAAGHEVACHSLHHTLLYEQDPAEFRRDLTRARALLQDLSGQAVFGFRAPSWSITARSLWALDVVAETGFRYDSSLFPAANYLYGIDGAPADAAHLETPNGNELLEIPPTTVGLGRLRLGVGGGVYLRVLPLLVHRAAMERARLRGVPFVAYVHPRELDPASWSLALPLDLRERLIHGFGLGRGASRALALLRRGGWEAFERALPAS